MADAPTTPSIGSKLWKAIGNILQVGELWRLAGGSMLATLTATVVRLVDAGALIGIFATLSAFALGALAVQASTAWLLRRSYRQTPPRTWLEASAGPRLMLLIHHRGLPVTARVVMQVKSFNIGVNPHPEPYDIHFGVTRYGGSHREVSLSQDQHVCEGHDR